MYTVHFFHKIRYRREIDMATVIKSKQVCNCVKSAYVPRYDVEDSDKYNRHISKVAMAISTGRLLKRLIQESDMV